MDAKLTEKIIGAAIEIHRSLGPRLLESAYQECILFELESLGLKVEKKNHYLLIYKNVELDHEYRIDLLVENQVIIKLKTVESLTEVHTAQILTLFKTWKLSDWIIN